VLSGKSHEVLDSTADDALSVSGGCLPLLTNSEQKSGRNFELVPVRLL
jgi:hypothetical protein